MAVKVSEGLDGTYLAAGSAEYLFTDRAQVASWIMADRNLVPVDRVFTREGADQVIFAHNPTLNYAAPGGAYVIEGRSG